MTCKAKKGVLLIVFVFLSSFSFAIASIEEEEQRTVTDVISISGCLDQYEYKDHPGGGDHYGCGVYSIWVSLNSTDPSPRRFYVVVWEEPHGGGTKNYLYRGYLYGGDTTGSLTPDQDKWIFVRLYNQDYSHEVEYDGSVTLVHG